MIGGRKGPPQKTRAAEAVPAVRTKTSNKVPINTILFIFFTSSAILSQRVKTLYFSLYLFDVFIKLFIHDPFHFQGFKYDESSEEHFLKATSSDDNPPEIKWCLRLQHLEIILTCLFKMGRNPHSNFLKTPSLFIPIKCFSLFKTAV